MGKTTYTVSDKGLEQIIKHEGEILKVYLDPVGLPTVGVGHLLLPSEKKIFPVGTRITKEVSRHFLRKDIARFEKAVNAAVNVPINQNQFDALVSLSFNIGEGAFKRSTVLKKLNNGDVAGAADAFLAWNKAGGRVLPGLVTRRKAERKLFLTPVQGRVPAADSSVKDQPAPVSGDAQDQTAPAASPSVSTDKEPVSGAGIDLEKVADSTTRWINKSNDISVGVSKFPFFGHIATRATAIIAFIGAFISSNWELALIAFLLFVIATWVYMTFFYKKAVKHQLASTDNT